MNLHRTIHRSLQVTALFAGITILGSAFWFVSDLYSSEYDAHEAPNLLISETAPMSVLPDGVAENETLSPDDRAIYSALNDTLYTTLSNYNITLAHNSSKPETSVAGANSPELPTAKTQCAIRAHTGSFDKLNGVAMNKECL